MLDVFPMRKLLASPTTRLLAGLMVTLAAVGVSSYYTIARIAGLRDLQTRLVDRNRRDSLQLLRIQNNLNALGLATRDMIEGSEPYPLVAWKGQFDRVRADLEDALRREAELAPDLRSGDQQQYFSTLFAQMWITVDHMFELARAGNERAARDLILNSLQGQQAAVSNTSAGLLIQNNEAQEAATARIQSIYDKVERNIYLFLIAVLVLIAATGTYLAYSNRQVFARLERLSEQRSALSRKLIRVQEEVLWSISRELHDEFGQILTALGAMLRRVEKQDIPERAKQDLDEIRDIVQSTLDKTRSLSQALHPAILDTGGLEQAIDWYVPVFQKQTGINVHLELAGQNPGVADQVAIHVYRVVQEGLNNIAKHAQSPEAWVRLEFEPNRLVLEIRDRGVGLPPAGSSVRHGIGLVAMRERAELLGGSLHISRPAEGGTLVRLEAPLGEREAGATNE
jgi:signal transduction histidine kinase